MRKELLLCASGSFGSQRQVACMKRCQSVHTQLMTAQESLASNDLNLNCREVRAAQDLRERSLKVRAANDERQLGD